MDQSDCRILPCLHCNSPRIMHSSYGWWVVLYVVLYLHQYDNPLMSDHNEQ